MDIVLIHGASHGSWCWEKTKPELERRGHRVFCPDLSLKTLHESVMLINLSYYCRVIYEVIDAVKTPVWLLGHSLGGAVITKFYELYPDRVAGLIYLAGFVPDYGGTVNDLLFNNPYPSSISECVTVDEEKGLLFLDVQKSISCFYNDCDSMTQIWAAQQLLPQPIAAMNEKIYVKNYSVPHGYIETLKDRTLTVKFQRNMYRSKLFNNVITLKSGHSPFFSDSENLIHAIENFLHI